jgi:hypothetical protein
VTRRKLRLATVAVAAALTVSLAACQTYQGTAAYVGDTRITTDEVETQVNNFYAEPFWAKQAQGLRGAVHFRTMNAMVLLALVKHIATDQKVTVGGDEVGQLTATLKKSPEQVDQSLQGAPTPLVAELIAYAQAIQKKLAKKATSQDQVNEGWKKLLDDAPNKYPVTVNPRYGTFNGKTRALERAKEAGIRELPKAPPAGQQQQQQQQQPPDQQQQQQPPDQQAPDQQQQQQPPDQQAPDQQPPTPPN